MNGSPNLLEIRTLSRELAVPTIELLRAVAADPDGKFFTPHPFTEAVLENLANAPGRDRYFVLMAGDLALAYGLLRGWNEGHIVPSLGLAISPNARGRGLGRLMMTFLHTSARHLGADRIRLRVHPENERAVRLYRSMGYSFEPPDPATRVMVGVKDLVVVR